MKERKMTDEQIESTFDEKLELSLIELIGFECTGDIHRLKKYTAQCLLNALGCIKFLIKDSEINKEFDPEETVHKSSSKHTVYVKKEKKFKVDKLGWYELKNIEDSYTTKGQCVYIDEKLEECCFKTFYRNSEDSYLCLFNTDGTPISDACIKVIKYLGLELPKEPRRFEFYASLREFPDSEYSEFYSMEKALGHSCGELYSKDYEYSDKDNISKWHVTMEEIIDEI